MPKGYSQLKAADVIFVGEAIRTKPTGRNKGVTVFRVVSKQKGLVVGKKVSVKHYTRQVFCKFPNTYNPGKEYKVFAKRGFLGRLHTVPRGNLGIAQLEPSTLNAGYDLHIEATDGKINATPTY